MHCKSVSCKMATSYLNTSCLAEAYAILNTYTHETKYIYWSKFKIV